MPIYVYRCPQCAEEFDLKDSFNSSSEHACPKCKGRATRVLSPVPIIFNGPGFYVTDHRKAVSSD